MRPTVLVPALVAIAAVGLGLLLGLGSSRGAPPPAVTSPPVTAPAARPRSSAVGALRTFAFTAALTVALTHLLPEALGELGAPGLLLFAAASLAPAWGRLLRTFTSRGRSHTGHAHGNAALSAGYLGLVVHHVGDGLGLGAYSELPGGPAAHADVLLALAVHTVPLVAVVTLAFHSAFGTRSAVERAAGLAAASVGGVILSNVVPADRVHSISAWIAAGVAGLLLHVVTHDLGRDLPVTNGARAVDFVAAAAGIGTSFLGADPDIVELRARLLRTFGQILELAAPALVLGWLIALLLTRLEADAFGRWLRPLPGRARGFDGALTGTAIGGPRFGLLFWVGTALSARLSALRSPADPPALVHVHAPDPHSHEPHSHEPHSHEPHSHEPHSHETRRATPGFLVSPTHPLALCLRDTAAWIVAGLVLTTVVAAAMPDDALAGLSSPAALIGAALYALPVTAPPVAAVLFALGLWDRGLRPDAALAFALIASARKDTLRALAFALLVGIGVGSVNAPSQLYLQTPHPVATAGIALLALGVAVATWERGIRGLFSEVFHSHDSA